MHRSFSGWKKSSSSIKSWAYITGHLFFHKLKKEKMYLNSLKNLKKPNWVFFLDFSEEEKNLLCLVLGPLKLEHKFVRLTFKHRNVAKPCGIHCKIQTGCLKKKRFFLPILQWIKTPSATILFLPVLKEHSSLVVFL